MDESADTPDETPEGSSDADEDGLTRLEEELAVIEAAMDRIDNGDLEEYDRLAAQLGQPDDSATIEALSDQEMA
ncbi:MAG: hypothetical protein VX833_07615 [Actinomycetota bacterium]|nr:hypothetical protein [Actinomycetota bacterium]